MNPEQAALEIGEKKRLAIPEGGTVPPGPPTEAQPCVVPRGPCVDGFHCGQCRQGRSDRIGTSKTLNAGIKNLAAVQRVLLVSGGSTDPGSMRLEALKTLARSCSLFGSRMHRPKRCCRQYVANFPRTKRLCHDVVPAEV
jgi:hypothetical protein